MSIEKAYWERKILSEQEMNNIISNNTHGQLCWRVIKYLGSMLVFDFGGKILSKLRSGNLVELGTSILSVHDCYWEIYRHNTIITDSDSIDDEIAKNLTKIFIDSELKYIAVNNKKNTIDWFFSNEIILSTDIINKYESSNDCGEVELTIPDGRIYKISLNGIIYLSEYISSTHLKSV
jgi:hypothetical protein